MKIFEYSKPLLIHINRGEWLSGLMKQKVALRDKKKNLDKEVNGKFNNIGIADESK